MALELLDDREVSSVLGEVSGVLTVGLGDLGGSGTSGMEGNRTGVNGDQEGDTGARKVVGGRHDDG